MGRYTYTCCTLYVIRIFWHYMILTHGLRETSCKINPLRGKDSKGGYITDLETLDIIVLKVIG